MKKILICLQHELQEKQITELKQLGYDIYLLREENPEIFNKMANSPSDPEDIRILADEFVNFILRQDIEAVLLPLGSPALMFQIAKYLGEDFWLTQKAKKQGYNPLPKFFFAHSTRVSEDVPQPDGTVKKVQVFKHEKFIVL